MAASKRNIPKREPSHLASFEFCISSWFCNICQKNIHRNLKRNSNNEIWFHKDKKKNCCNRTWRMVKFLKVGLTDIPRKYCQPLPLKLPFWRHLRHWTIILALSRGKGTGRGGKAPWNLVLYIPFWVLKSPDILFSSFSAEILSRVNISMFLVPAIIYLRLQSTQCHLSILCC